MATNSHAINYNNKLNRYGCSRQDGGNLWGQNDNLATRKTRKNFVLNFVQHLALKLAINPAKSTVSTVYQSVPSFAH